jgi:hypothetical protein
LLIKGRVGRVEVRSRALLTWCDVGTDSARPRYAAARPAAAIRWLLDEDLGGCAGARHPQARDRRRGPYGAHGLSKQRNFCGWTGQYCA